MNEAKIENIRTELRRCRNSGKARDLQWFFKTGPGGYGEGDIFLGVRVPELHRLAKKYKDLPLSELPRLLESAIHEERLLALFILVLRYDRGDYDERGEIYRLYLRYIQHVNNWDLVDGSAPHIVGRHLFGRSRAPLRRLARSRSIWKRRIAVMATFYFVRQGEFADTLAIADLLMTDREDLIHKAVGWMIREVANRNREVAEAFLQEHFREMPRTMLRYAIEKFPEGKRKLYLQKRAQPALLIRPGLKNIPETEKRGQPRTDIECRAFAGRPVCRS